MLRKRQDYKPPSFLVTSVFLNIDIQADTDTLVITKLNLCRNSQAGCDEPLWLDGTDIQLDKLVVDGSEVSLGKAIPDFICISSEGLSLRGLGDNAVVEIHSRCSPRSNTKLEGLYLSGGMYCTQCEPEGFRRISYYPDRPDVMSEFTVRIEASNAFPQILSNGNLIEVGEVGLDRHYAIWNDPHPKPSYLFAVVVGDLDYVSKLYTTASGRDVELKIYVEKGNASLTAHAMDSLVRSMRWDEKEYDLEYDLDLFQIVAVSNFNMGAMENKGLNIFNSKFVLADTKTATDDDLNRVESIVAHEYFHNWTGNRVTCRDWFQLTLKEGLTVFRDQCFSADMHDTGVQRATDVAMLRAAQFPEDRSPTAHPIRPESYKEINNFYTATIYEKGAEVIRMLAGFLGKEGFKRGIDLYFERHDGKAVTCDDFLLALSDANVVNLDLFQGWYSQAGTPIVKMRRKVGKSLDHMVLSLSQSIPETAAKTPRKVLPIPLRLAFLDQSGQIVPTQLSKNGALNAEHVILLDKAEKDQSVFAPAASHLIPSILRNFSAPVILNDDLSTDERRHIMVFDTDLFNRWDSAQNLVIEEILTIAENPYLEINTARILGLGSAFSDILEDPTCLEQFKASILTLPSMSVLESRVSVADPISLYEARLAFEAALGHVMAAQYSLAFAADRAEKMSKTAGGRALFNRLLALGVASGNPIANNIAETQVLNANMTLSQGALTAVNNCPTSARKTVLAAFHDRWKDNGLVLEKWFSFEASSCVSGNVERLKALMEHPAFDPGNPNKLRAVLGSFMIGNPVWFYAKDGKGLNFIADCLIDIDQRNPQLAARMALPMTRISGYCAVRQEQMKVVLERLRKEAKSTDLIEVLDKALA